MPDLFAPFLGGHSLALYLLAAGAAAAVGVAGWLHARRYWEGLPPLLDGLISALGLLAVLGAFAVGGQWGAMMGAPHAGRVIAVAATLILWRWLRTWLAKEQARQRGTRR